MPRQHCRRLLTCTVSRCRTCQCIRSFKLSGGRGHGRLIVHSRNRFTTLTRPAGRPAPGMAPAPLGISWPAGGGKTLAR